MASAVPEAQEALERNPSAFIRTELDVGMTFASLALQNKTGEKRERASRDARKAYDTAMHFWQKHPIKESGEGRQLLSRFTMLKEMSLRLGERFEE